MSSRQAPDARRSQIVTTYGVGSLFPARNESFMVMGLDEWPDSGPDVNEPRLARALRVPGFRQPPAGDDRGRDVPVIRFPEIHFCPVCRRLGPIWTFCNWNENECRACSAELVPSRFVICCSRGHIDEFPYHLWLHNNFDGIGKDHELRLDAQGRSSSLGDIRLSCSCGATPVSMEGAFAADAFRNLRSCAGRRPWLGAESGESCTEVPRTLQRGSSNVWFPVVRSAISIPPWSEGVHRLLDRFWPVLTAVPESSLRETLSEMRLPPHSYSFDQLTDAILRRRDAMADDEPDEDLLPAEYKALVAGRPESGDRQDFVCEPVAVDQDLRPFLGQVSRVSRLREVRALSGFTRVLPLSHETPPDHIAPLRLNSTSWLPAVEVLGEGVFLRLDEDSLADWEQSTFARDRAELLQRTVDRRSQDQGLSEWPRVEARQLLLHSLAHALVEQFSLDAGYPSASLRERVFWGDDMSGVLIYTATSDAAGSLGGVAAHADEDRLAHALLGAVSRLSWCSSDPVCVESRGSGADALNLAACHACLLVPETSCERNNTFLDRATLVGTPESPEGGYFSELLVRR
ncbi:DUF1998 domain-containing protein [Pseudonocardia alni subsp. carboxydivorans]|uniref:DUF1998 domain-containing protein n=1 Tax=Pseudonocardia alni subsp. carboxydivorans TaxID=415010 RepID=A0ABU9AJG5_PSEA5